MRWESKGAGGEGVMSTVHTTRYRRLSGGPVDSIDMNECGPSIVHMQNAILHPELAIAHSSCQIAIGTPAVSLWRRSIMDLARSC